MGGDGGFRIVAGWMVLPRCVSRWTGQSVMAAWLRHGQVGAVTAWEFPPVTVRMEGLVRDPDVFPQTACLLQNEAHGTATA